jgi:hypothetical protein
MGLMFKSPALFFAQNNVYATHKYKQYVTYIHYNSAALASCANWFVCFEFYKFSSPTLTFFSTGVQNFISPDTQ